MGIPENKEFRVVRRILGHQGENVKRIATEAHQAAYVAYTDHYTKVSVCGEGARNSNAAEYDGPLAILVKAASEPAFERAAARVEEHLARVHQEYRDYYQTSALWLVAPQRVL